MSLAIAHNNSSPFDAIRQTDENSNEYWSARDLMIVMGYPRWSKFENPINQAIENLKLNEDKVSNHFLPSMVKSQGRTGKDYKLSRYACYMVALCCDGRKPEVALAKKYFATKTREAEVVIPQQSDRIRELELALALAQAETQKMLAEKSILDIRHLIVTTCPEPVQQKILGYQVVKEIEYRDRIIHDEQLIHNGETLTKTELCKRYGFIHCKSGKPNYTQLSDYLAKINLPSQAWELKARIQDTQELRREYLPELDRLLINNDRQMWIGEGE